MNRISAIQWCCLIGMLFMQPVSAQQLTDLQFQKLHRQLRPAADEPWLTIPWKISLLEAQRLATQKGKPIFIWAMDGHPLGCT